MIPAVPALSPVTLPPVPVSDTPDVVDQLPPAVASLSDNTLPTHTRLPPRIAPGLAFTLTVMLVPQPDVA